MFDLQKRSLIQIVEFNPNLIKCIVKLYIYICKKKKKKKLFYNYY